MTGTTPPSIQLGVSIVATQNAVESDDFGPDYDVEASLPVIGGGSYTIVGNENMLPVEVRGPQNEKLAAFEVPKSALLNENEGATINVEEVPARTGDFVLEVGETVKSYDIEMPNLDPNNTEPIIAKLRIESAGVYVAKEDIKIYHDGVQILAEDIIGYNYNTGYVSFYTTSFSPFDVIYTVSDMPENMVFDTTPNPVAGLVAKPEYAIGGANADIEWGGYGSWSPNPAIEENPQLETVYKFSAPSAEEAAASPFANWYCDFYVMLDTDLGQDQAFLGGNYGIHNWVGFHNGSMTLEANTFYPILGGVGMQWIYADIASVVSEFMCGVNDVDGVLDGHVLTLQLRLINPNDASDYRVVSEIRHTFGTDMSADYVWAPNT